MKASDGPSAGTASALPAASGHGLPLSGVRVLEFSQAVLGPCAGMVLADLGADVLRIEPVPKGDPTRYLKGFGMGYFPFFNRNKRSLMVDLKSARGNDLIHRLLSETDVLVENFGPGTMERLELGHAQLEPDYPALVYCSLKGFLPGPYEKRVALDEVVQIMSGLAYMTGPSGRPLRAGASVIDIMTGVYGALGVVLALQQRSESGRGGLVQSALFETAAFVMGHHMAYAAASGEEVPPMPERVSAWSIYQQFRTRDEQTIFVGVISDKQWKRFCHAFERDDLARDERLGTNNDRIAQREWLLPEVERMIAAMTADEVVRRCEQAEIPFSPLARPEDLFDDQQLLHGGSLLPTTFPDGAETRLPGLPFLLSGERLGIRRQPPRPGEQTLEVLREHGLADDEIESLLAAGVVAGVPATAQSGRSE